MKYHPALATGWDMAFVNRIARFFKSGSAAKTQVPHALGEGYDVLRPLNIVSPLVFSSPHSGRIYPPSFLARSCLDPHDLRRSEDVFVDELFSGVTSFGAPLLHAHFPRAFLDVNREPFELDPNMFFEDVPSYANTCSPRLTHGLGTIPRTVGDQLQIYDRKLSIDEALERIETFYRAYHRALSNLLEDTHGQFGSVILVDCHSMPSSQALNGRNMPFDIVIGDRYGSSCGVAVTHSIEQQFRSRGYSVAMNRPYAGGFITEFYNAPYEGIHTVQIEINRAIYVNERTLDKRMRFNRLASDLTEIFANLSDDWRRQANSLPMAAE